MDLLLQHFQRLFIGIKTNHPGHAFLAGVISYVLQLIADLGEDIVVCLVYIAPHVILKTGV